MMCLSWHYGARSTFLSADPIRQFYSDALSGTLPSVWFVDPRCLGEAESVSNDDHPHAVIRNGEAFLNSIYSAVTRGLGWANTALVINYDEWGGFFEHVPPPTTPIPPASATAGDTDGRLGFRVPYAICATELYQSQCARSLLDSEDDRVALAASKFNGSRRTSSQSCPGTHPGKTKSARTPLVRPAGSLRPFVLQLRHQRRRRRRTNGLPPCGDGT
jgi:Phosphoesterase family